MIKTFKDTKTKNRFQGRRVKLFVNIEKEHVVRTVPYPKPGEILLEEFLKPMNIAKAR